MDKKFKQPGETLDYDIKADGWLGDGDYIVTAITTVSAVGLTVIATTVILSGTRVKVMVSGGTNGVKYKVTVTMTTNDGLVKEHEFYIQIKEL